MRPFKVYLIEIAHCHFVRATPTESSHSWWEVIDPVEGFHKQAIHRSEFGRIKSL